MDTRIERDTMGSVEVPKDALYGAQTQRAITNFTISNEKMPERFIRTVIMIKRAAAITNKMLNVIEPEKSNAIIQACDQLSAKKDLLKHFPVSVYQTGSGTSTNMNANEVIARLAQSLSGESIHPNDHVNAGQSSNDVIPTAIHVSVAIALQTQLLPAISSCIQSIEVKAQSLKGLIKTGRTHLMDAVPIPFSEALMSWAGQLDTVKTSLIQLQPHLQRIAQGGTAIGTGINAHPKFQSLFCKQLSDDTKLSFLTPKNGVFHLMAGQETSALVAGQLKALAVALIKIANDLRWMNSGPLTGLSEISLPALQPGSSIMPGKVNPIIPEAVIMACYQVIGQEAAITMCCQSGHFELNVSLPLIAKNLLDGISILKNCLASLADKSIDSFSVNIKKIEQQLNSNPILATALNTKIGYEKSATIAKRAYQESRPVIDIAIEVTDIDRVELERILDPKNSAFNKSPI